MTPLNGKPPEVETVQMPAMVQIVIVYDVARDQAQVSGPLANKGLCYAVLGRAADAIRDHKPALVQPASNLRLVDGKPN